MRLSSIKLSGFKSFINPENINFTKNFCVIVGPNGCGKSNIIDAIRWVLGEGSARHLRGAAMVDVIFSGSDTRPAAARAYVELIFDNSDGRIQNQFANYAEISVARQLTTDGISRFYLNGQSCRRRDITDVFSGTGLGPRGYSVVEQGMITSLVEASPEALRMQLEEAAGISKYKERRRETETRMQHTRTNMQRITDINKETASQAAHLKQQSEVADKYRMLKAELNLVQAKRLYLQWRDLNNNQKRLEQKVREQDNQLAKASAEHQHLSLEAETKQSELENCREATDQAQAVNYEMRTSITNLEASNRSHDQQLQQLKEALKDNQDRHRQIDTRLDQDDGLESSLQSQLKTTASNLKAAMAEAATTKEALNAAEKTMGEWQNQWDALQQQYNLALRAQSDKASGLKLTTAIMEQIKPQIAALEAESTPLEKTQHEQHSEALDQQIQAINAEIAEHTTCVMKLEAERQQLHKTQQADSRALHELRLRLEKMLGEKTSIEIWLTKASSATDKPSKAWHSKAGLDAASRLSQDLSVPLMWQAAVELVLGSLLSGLIVEDLEELTEKLSTAKGEQITLIEDFQTKLTPADSTLGLPILSELLNHPHPAARLLQCVYVAKSKQEALSKRHLLAAHESIITAECFRVSPFWVHNQATATGQDTEHSGILESTAKLATLSTAIDEQQAVISKAEATFEENNSRNELLQKQLEEGTEVLLGIRTKKADLEADQRAYALKNKEQTERNVRVRESLAKLTTKYAQEEASLSTTSGALELAENQVGELEAARAGLIEKRETLIKGLAEARQAQDAAQKLQHETELTYQGHSIESDNRELEKQSLTTKRSELVANRERLSAEMAVLHPKIANLTTKLQEALSAHSKQEKELVTLQKNNEVFRQQLQEINSGKNEAAENIEVLRGELDTVRLEHKGYETQRDSLEQQLELTSHSKTELDEQISSKDSEAKLERKVRSLDSRLENLGPINMAAAEEYKVIFEKQQYLEQQHQDLETALATLEDAIARIDQETISRFKNVCEGVNVHLKKYFTKFFGGGTARLEMTSDNLLETGLIVMARPPGKKNSSIKLLSGGEKALTALALVFALFELNPAPLCVLDEVDAPLDDSNLQRYAKALQEMSQQIQFICVTHNKTSIEAAEQLVGITMQEPGVSRLIAVNLEEITAAITHQ